ncbi:MAG: aminopeptidase P family protein [Treponema sp.]|nr:aminopeptidase P family protein [Treponema sp.]
MKEAIRKEQLDGWLFCNFRHRDKLADEILKIRSGFTNSRRWIYAVPLEGEPLKIVHAIEGEALNDLPGREITYISRDDLLAGLKRLGGKRWGVHSSPALAAISYLDAGTAETFREAGLILCSAAGLVQRFKGLLDRDAIASHERAAEHLYQIVEIAWDRVKRAYTGGMELYEGNIQDLINDEFARRHLVTDHLPIVAAGGNSGNPHYDFSGMGARFKEGDVIQFDLWAKENKPGAVIADISWAGIFAAGAPEGIAKTFGDLVNAREGALRYIEEELSSCRNLSGADVDRKTRSLLIDLGYEAALKHRTGHGIDTEVHGSGVNMDSVEFPDSRLILEGSCFSLEPGIYFPDFGFRTEIDVYIQNGRPVVSGGGYRRQFGLLCCGEESGIL